jgi:hypothetical protein
MNRSVLCLSAAVAVAAISLPPSIASAERVQLTGSVGVQACQERVGPFASQDRAYQVRRQAQAMGYDVSGVFPCYQDWTRGYCFNAFQC